MDTDPTSSPFDDTRQPYGNTYIARVSNGKQLGFALVVTVSGERPWYRRSKNLPFRGFLAGYLDLWETGRKVPNEESTVDGVSMDSQDALIDFIDGWRSNGSKVIRWPLRSSFSRPISREWL